VKHFFYSGCSLAFNLFIYFEFVIVLLCLVMLFSQILLMVLNVRNFFGLMRACSIGMKIFKAHVLHSKIAIDLLGKEKLRKKEIRLQLWKE
jgi:hypothetical protein